MPIEEMTTETTIRMTSLMVHIDPMQAFELELELEHLCACHIHNPPPCLPTLGKRPRTGLQKGARTERDNGILKAAVP